MERQPVASVLLLLLAAFAALAQTGPELPSCPDGPLFSVIPMEPEDFLAFRPLGFTSFPVHLFPAKHSAFSMAVPPGKAPVRPVRFPGDLWVTEIWSTAFPSGASGYQLYIQPCREVRGYINHLGDIAPTLKAAFDAGEQHCQNYTDLNGTIVKCQVRVSVKVDAGDLAGASGDSSAGVDFGLADFRRKPEGLVNLEHYPTDYPYYVSPVDYYEGETRARFEATLASWDGQTPRTAEPRAGAYRPDIPGTAQGNWFYPGVYLRTSTGYSSAIALVSDYIDPAQPVFSIGTTVAGVRSGMYSFLPQPYETRVNVPFAQVAPQGGVFCYERFLEGRTAGALPLGRIDGVLLVTMPDETSILVEYQPGTCEDLRPWSVTGGATRYER